MSDLKPCPFCGGDAVKVDGFTVACAHGLCIGWTVRRASPHEWNTRALPAVQPAAHVNETPKSEHETRDMLTPATKGGAEPTDAQPDLTDPNVVHANMLRGTIAKPTLEQIRHLYGDAVQIKMTMQDEAEAQLRWVAATKGGA